MNIYFNRILYQYSYLILTHDLLTKSFQFAAKNALINALSLSLGRAGLRSQQVRALKLSCESFFVLGQSDTLKNKIRKKEMLLVSFFNIRGNMI